MPVQSRNRMLEEIELAARFSETYRKKFATLIDRLSHGLYGAADRDGLRLCIEAVDMMLASQSHIANALASLGSTTPARCNDGCRRTPPSTLGTTVGKPKSAKVPAPV